MNTIILAIIIVGGVGLLAGVGLAVASVVMAVPVEDRLEQLREALPRANCGACGFSGCDSYADAVANGAECNLCPPGGPKTALMLGKIMGKEVKPAAKKVAVVRCRGAVGVCKPLYEYKGELTCGAAAHLYRGPKECDQGCLGFGDCVRVCAYDAISIVDGIASVDREKCCGCTACMTVCPKGTIEITLAGKKAVNLCKNEDFGAVSRRQCSAACIGCKLCEKACPIGAVSVTGNHAYVNDQACTGCGLCISKCPSKCLVHVEV